MTGQRNKKSFIRLVKRSLVAGLLAGAMGLWGCGITDVTQDSEIVHTAGEDTITPIDDSLIVVGVSQVGSESVWRTANTNSIQETFTTEAGYFLIFENARQKQENQIKAIRGFISQQVDYIVFSPITEDGWDTVLQEAKDAGIPVILFDRKLNVEDESLYTTWVGSDFHEEGEKAGKWLQDYLKKVGREEEEINIVELQGTAGATAVIGRTAGFEDVAEHNENWHILDRVDGEYTTTKGKEVMRQMLAEYPEIHVVVAQNDDMMFGAIDAIEEAGYTTGPEGDIIVISFDACKNALQMIADKQLNVDVECNPLQGPYIEGIIEQLEKGEKVERETYIKEQVFDISNVDESIEERTY